jgi:hypothetical protein
MKVCPAIHLLGLGLKRQRLGPPRQRTIANDRCCQISIERWVVASFGSGTACAVNAVLDVKT